MRTSLLGWVVVSLLAAGCECSSGTIGAPCEFDVDCTGMEVCDLVTDTCQLPETDGGSTTCPDADGDGATTCAGDCDDANALASPTLAEVCGDTADNDCDGQSDEGCTGGIGTFVSQLTGLDSNPGTQAMPVQTIGQGIRNAMTIGGAQSVIVAEGTYAEKVTLVEGVDLLGGYSCDTTAGTWARDTAANVSTIQNTDFEGVLAGAGITNATLLEGFRIEGLDGVPPAPPGSAGIILLGGAPTIRGNTIVGGDVTGGGFAADRSIGISGRETSGAVIEGNDITGGAAVRVSAGILFDSWPATTRAIATVRANTLRGGTGERSMGLVAWNTDPGTLVTGNEISAGNSTNGASHGIEVGGTMTIDGNRINTNPASVGTCTSPTGWCAGIASESSTSTITNNVVYGPRGSRTAGVFLGEFEIPAGAVVLNGNYLNGGGMAGTESAALVVSIGPCTTCGFNGFVGRVRNNILDGGSNTSRFGVREDPAATRSMRPEVLENNLFYFAPAGGSTDVLYRQVPSTGTTVDHLAISAVNGMSMPMTSGNIAGDPLIDTSWHLMNGSPCIDVGTSTEAPANDRDGDARPSGAAVDIGADET